MPISSLPAAVLGLTLGWLDISEAAVAILTCKAWLSAVQNGRSASGSICLMPLEPAHPTASQRLRMLFSQTLAPSWKLHLELILASFWRRHIGELCFPWSVVFTEHADLECLSEIASAMPQLERLSLTVAMDLLPLDKLELPAQLRELRLQIQLGPNQGRVYDIRRGVEPSAACIALQQRVAATLCLVHDAAPQLRALTIHVGGERTYYTLWRSACDVILRFKQLERLYVYIEARSMAPNGPEAAMLTLLGSQMPRLRTLITKSAEWDFQESWRSCPKGKTTGTPIWTAETIALLVAGPRDQCVLEYIGQFTKEVTEDEYEELRRRIPTLKQPLRA